MAFHDSEEGVVVRPCSIVFCGPGEGHTDQYACAFQDAIRMLLRTWEPIHMTATTASARTGLSHKITSEVMDNHNDTITSASSSASPFQKCMLEPGCVIHDGGTFEFLLHHALLQHGHNCSVSDHTDESVTAVSKLLANALLSVPQQIYSHSPRRFLQTQTRVLTSIENHFHPFILDVGLESVSCKYQLVLAALQCVTSLLRVDTMLHTNTRSHTRSSRLTKNISWVDTEDETED